MKSRCLWFALVLLAGVALADESGCPSHIAAQRGFAAFGVFHEVMAPAWHVAWPAKDYEALFAAGPRFREAFLGLQELKPQLNSAERAERYRARFQRFEELVVAYSRAAASGDQEKVYALMPELHDAFESTASVLLPVEYPTLSGFRVTLDLIRNEHLPANNTEGLVGSTETLVMKAALLTEESIPTELKDQQAEILLTLEKIRALAGELKGHCDAGNWEQYRNTLESIHSALAGFEASFL